MTQKDLEILSGIIAKAEKDSAILEEVRRNLNHNSLLLNLLFSTSYKDRNKLTSKRAILLDPDVQRHFCLGFDDTGENAFLSVDKSLLEFANLLEVGVLVATINQNRGIGYLMLQVSKGHTENSYLPECKISIRIKSKTLQDRLRACKRLYLGSLDSNGVFGDVSLPIVLAEVTNDNRKWSNYSKRLDDEKVSKQQVGDTVNIVKSGRKKVRF